MTETNTKLAKIRGSRKLVKGPRNAVPSSKAPAPESPGTLDWTADVIYGGREQLVGMIETLARGEGEGDGMWRKFYLTYKQWQIDWEAGHLPHPPTLNQVAYALKISAPQLFERLAADTSAIYSRIGRLKAALATPQVIDAAIMASRDIESGYKDRELLLKLGGTLADNRGPLVAIQNNQTTINTAPAQPILSQFSEQAAELDAQLRQAARSSNPIVEGEIVND